MWCWRLVIILGKRVAVKGGGRLGKVIVSRKNGSSFFCYGIKSCWAGIAGGNESNGNYSLHIITFTICQI